MTDKPPVTHRFNDASKQSAREAAVKARADEAIRRMAKSFERNEPHLVDRRHAELLAKQAAMPELKPSFAAEDPISRTRKVAKYQVKQEHRARILKIKTVADKMMGKGNEALER